MTRNTSSNIAISIFNQIKQIAVHNNEDLNLLIIRYGVERMLYRLSISPHSTQFVLKGSSLFNVWKGHNYRATKDVDFLGFGPPEENRLLIIFQELCAIDTSEIDGVTFLKDSVKVKEIREGSEYEGLRVHLKGNLDRVKLHVQIDIGFGDVVTPKPKKVKYPVIIDLPIPRLKVYPAYSVISEKFECMVKLGMANSRMKDFFDIWILSRLFEFDGETIQDAIKKTFIRRGTLFSKEIPVALTKEFFEDREKQTQWSAFIKKAKVENPKEKIRDTISDLRLFLVPVIESIIMEKKFKSKWTKKRSWQKGFIKNTGLI